MANNAKDKEKSTDNVVTRVINHIFNRVRKLKVSGFSRTPAKDYVNCDYEVTAVSRKNESKPFIEILIKDGEDSGETFWFSLAALAGLDQSPVVDTDEDGKVGLDESMKITWTSKMAEPAFKEAA